MIVDFDVTSDGQILVYTNAGIYGDLSIRLFDTTCGTDALVLDDSWAPQGPRLSVSGKTLGFYGDLKIFIHDLVANETKIIFDQEGFIAGFCELSHDCRSIAFSARSKDSPPSIFAYHLPDHTTRRITDDLGGDRFPHWSSSDNYIAYTRQYLSDLHKRRWVGVYCSRSERHYLVPKGNDSTCILDKHCWAPSSDVLVYLELKNGNGVVKLYSPSDGNTDSICRTTDVREVSFWDETHLLMISEDKLQSYSLGKRRITMSVEVPSSERIHFRPDGAVIRVSRKAVYFLTDGGNIYKLDLSGAVKSIRQSHPEQSPEFEKSELTIRSYDGKRVLVYHYVPEISNGYVCMFIIGGPGGAAKSEDRVIMRFLREGYELIVPAYRGCRENPGNHGMMGYGDVRDVIEAGRYFKVKTGFDLPIVGYSYGGLLTMLALATAGEVFSCGVSLWGVTAVERLALHLHKVLTDEMSEEERQRVLDERSAVKRSKEITRPLLILHGDQDTTPTEEVRQICKNIQANGVHCELVVYKNDTHGLRKNTDDYHSRVLRFLNSFAQKNNESRSTSHN